MDSHVEMTTPDVADAGDSTRVRPQWRSLVYFTTRRHLAPLMLACTCSLVCGVLAPALAILLGLVFKELASFGSQSVTNIELLHNISVYCLYLVALGAISWIAHTIHFGLWVVYGQLQAKAARESLFDALLRAELEWFETIEDGVAALLPRIQTYIHDFQQATSQPLGFTVQNLAAAIASLMLALYISWKLALVSLATVPLSALVIGVASKKIQQNMEAQQVELTTASKLANGAISSVNTVKQFTAEESEIRRYVAAIQSAAGWYIKEALACASEIGCIHFLTFSMFVQGFWYGGHLVSTGELDAGQVLTTFWACLQATQSLQEIVPQLMILEKGRSAAGFLQHFLGQVRRSHIQRRKSGRKSPRYCEGNISFKDVVFAYPSQPDRPVLRNCSLYFPVGELTFILGKSGSGKSTIGNLLMKFYRPSSGEILIDENSIDTVDTNWIRNNITLVQQQSVLFNETIFKNIAFGARYSEDVTETDVLSSVGFADLSSILHKLPNGLDTVVGLHGNLLSGGQRQRVALARAKLRDTPILILDESTSALDPSSRRKVMSALRSWRKGRTTIIITHDSSQILDHEFVYIVDQGQVTHQGDKRAIEREAPELFQIPTSSDRPTTPFTETPSREDTRERLTLCDPRVTPISPLFYRRPSLQQFQSLGPADKSPRMKSSFGSRTALASSSMARKGFEAKGLDDDAIPDLANDSDREAGNEDGELLGQSQKQRNNGYVPMSRVASAVISSLGLRNRLFLVLGFLCAVAHAAATPAFSYVFSHLLTTFFVTEDRSRKALQWALGVVGVSAANGIASFGMHYLLERCSQAWADHLRYQSMKRILSQPTQWFEQDGNHPSRIVNCLDQKAEEMKNLIGKFAGFVLVAAVMIVVGVTWGTVVCWKLALVGAGCAPFLYALTRIFDSVTLKWESRSGYAKEVIADIFSETFLDIRSVRALTLESYLHRKFYKASWQALTIGLKKACHTAALFGVSEASILFVYAVVFYYGAVLVSSLEYSTSEILLVFSMLLFSMGNVKAVLGLIPQISSSRDNATRVLELASLPEDSSHEQRGQSRILHPAPIKFTNVSFSYPSRPGDLVLQDFNLTIRENACTAIVGASGSGKSTLTSLLLSLYDMDSSPCISAGHSGSITLGGIDIRHIHVPTLRSRIAVVPQHPTLFPSSIRANITYGLAESSPFSTTENIHKAAEAAGIHEFISSLPSGYDTLVGDGGLGLSGGQIQRLAVARVLVRQPRVIILDEATSSLDLASAEVIRQTLRELLASRAGLTVIVITHAKEMLEIADYVVVMERGQVVEEGSSQEMLRTKSDGAFWRLGMGSWSREEHGPMEES